MSTPQWKFVLVNSSDLTEIGELHEARDKALSVGLNKSGSASFTYPFSGLLANEIVPVKTGIKAYRKGSTGSFVNVWSGYVNEITDDGASEKISVSCVGWFERLNNRIAKQDILYTSQYDHHIILGKTGGMSSPVGNSGFTCPSGIVEIANLTEANPSGPQIISATVPSGATVTAKVAAGEKVASGTTIVTVTPSAGAATDYKSTISNGFVVSVNGIKNTPSAVYTASGTFTLGTVAPYYSIPSGSFPSGVGAYPLPLMSGASTLTLMQPGDYEPTTTITPSGAAVEKNFKIEKDQSFGEAILQLTQLENGPDIGVDPETRELNVYRKKGSKKNIYFGYNWGPENLRNFSKTTTTDKLANQLIGRSNGLTPSMVATDEQSFDDYGLFEDVLNVQLSKADADILAKYTAAEYLFTSRPLITYSVSPFPWTNNSSVPEPFVEYEIGDQVYIRANKPPRLNQEKQLVRVFGINLTIDDEGNEQISDLQIYYE